MIEPLVEHVAQRLDTDRRVEVRERLAEETPIALLFNGEAHVVMMATPQDLEDFAFGFALSEGIVADAAELQLIEALPRGPGIALHLAIPAPRFEALQARRRQLPGRSGCGLCGAETLEQAITPVRRVTSGKGVVPDRLRRGFTLLAARQTLNRDCGGLHAAAALCEDELIVREDVGRHNALDKIVGRALLSGRLPLDDALLVVSGRSSYELVQKALLAGVPLVAGVSAPSSLAIDLAEATGITLCGFVRGASMNVYTHPHRVAGL